MRSIFRTFLLAIATFSFVAMAEFNATLNTDGQDPDSPSADLALRTPTDHGCYSSPGDMFDMGVYTYQSPGWCHSLCVRLEHTYFANVNGSNCFCGDKLPDAKYKVDNGNCDAPCGGTKLVMCGGINYWDVQDGHYQIGDTTGTQVIHVPAPTYTWTPPAAASSTASITQPATVTFTKAATTSTSSPSATSSPQASGPNTAAIAGGVVVGVLLLLAIVGGTFFFMRRRKQQAMAEEQRRHEVMTSFVSSEKPRSGYTSPDSRLDPSLMFQRRLSDGSIRDNEDYSRRILKVANPDD